MTPDLRGPRTEDKLAVQETLSTQSFWFLFRIGFVEVRDSILTEDLEFVVDQVIAEEKGWA